MRKYLLIGSDMPGYAERLVNAMDNKAACGLTSAAAQTAEELERFCRTHPVSLVLADERWISEGAFSELPGRPQIVALTENQELGTERCSLYRYQSVDEMIRKLTEVCGEEVISGPSPAGGKSVRLLAVYSPSLPSLKTAFALTLAAMEKRFRKTLYLNLEEFGGCSELLKGRGEKSLTDAVYYLKQEALDAQKLAAMIVTSGSVDYIPPMPFADDVREAGGEEWIRLLTRIAEVSDYEVIVVDLPQSLYISSDVIDACDGLYIPTGGDSISRAKLAELENWLERPEHRRMKEKARKIMVRGQELPETDTAEDYPEELLYGKFGEEVMREVPFERS